MKLQPYTYKKQKPKGIREKLIFYFGQGNLYKIYYNNEPVLKNIPVAAANWFCASLNTAYNEGYVYALRVESQKSCCNKKPYVSKPAYTTQQ